MSVGGAQAMGAGASRLVIVVHPGARTRSILAWLRQLVPAALLIVAAPNLPAPTPPDVIVLDDDDVASGPLSLAEALLRHQRHAHAPDAASHPEPPPSSLDELLASMGVAGQR